MRYLNGQKTQILIAHQKQGIDWTKKVQIAAKKSSARDKRILHTFFAVDHPNGTFRWKKTQIFIAYQEQSIDRTKKGWLGAKKVRLETRGFGATFLLLTTPYVMFE